MSEERVWFDDYAIGDTIVSPTRRIYESDVLGYVRFTNDVRSVLRPGADEDAVLEVPDLYAFSLGICLLLHAEGTYIPREFVAFYGFDSIDYHSRVFVGQSITSTAAVTELTPRGGNCVITMRHETLESTSGVRVLSSVQRMLVRRDPAPPAEGIGA